MLGNAIFQSLNRKYYKPGRKGVGWGIGLGLLVAVGLMLFLLVQDPGQAKLGDFRGPTFCLYTMLLMWISAMIATIRGLLGALVGSVLMLRGEIDSGALKAVISSPLKDHEVFFGYSDFALYRALRANQPVVAFFLTVGGAGMVFAFFFPPHPAFAPILPLIIFIPSALLPIQVVLSCAAGARTGTMYALRSDSPHSSVLALAHVAAVWLLGALVLAALLCWVLSLSDFGELVGVWAAMAFSPIQIVPFALLTWLNGRGGVKVLGRWRTGG